jgi:hypothetical protein
MKEFNKSVVPELIKKNSPLIRECMKPPLKLVKHQDYGLKKLYERLGKRSSVK